MSCFFRQNLVMLPTLVSNSWGYLHLLPQPPRVAGTADLQGSGSSPALKSSQGRVEGEGGGHLLEIEPREHWATSPTIFIFETGSKLHVGWLQIWNHPASDFGWNILFWGGEKFLLCSSGWLWTYVAQVGLQFKGILLPQPPGRCDYRSTPHTWLGGNYF